MAKPIKTIKYGQVELAVWQGEFDGKPTYSYSFQKSYKTKDGQWKQTNFFNDKELLQVGMLIVNATQLKIDANTKKREQNQNTASVSQEVDFNASDIGNVPF
jgi:CRISPR/Cas system-associated endonuclease Cas1